MPRRPMHHNAPALKRVSYLVDEDEAAQLAAEMPAADGASGSGARLWRPPSSCCMPSHPACNHTLHA